MKLLRGELTKLLFQKRTYVGWIGLLAIPILIVVALALSPLHRVKMMAQAATSCSPRTTDSSCLWRPSPC